MANDKTVPAREGGQTARRMHSKVWLKHLCLWPEPATILLGVPRTFPYGADLSADAMHRVEKAKYVLCNIEREEHVGDKMLRQSFEFRQLGISDIASSSATDTDSSEQINDGLERQARQAAHQATVLSRIGAR